MTTANPWDEGCPWHLSEPDEPPESVTLEFVRDSYLKLPSTTADNAMIARAIKASTRMAQRGTLRALVDQTYTLVLQRFPWGRIELPWPPLIEIEAFEYFDQNGAAQTLVETTGYQLSAPVGAMARAAYLYPPESGAWPSISSTKIDPVRITYRAGYVDNAQSPPDGAVPEDIIEGQLLVIGEMYKQRSESIVGFGISVTPALVNARGLWRPYAARVYK